MNIFFRILLAIYAFCLTLASFVVILFSLKLIPLDIVISNLQWSLDNNIYRLALLLVTVLFLGLSLTFLFSGLRRDKDKTSISKYTNVGEVKISMNTLENIALLASRRVGGVKEVKALVRKWEDGVTIALRTVVVPEVSIPLISEEVQIKVKEAIEQTAGIEVNDVKVYVENISFTYKARLE